LVGRGNGFGDVWAVERGWRRVDEGRQDEDPRRVSGVMGGSFVMERKRFDVVVKVIVHPFFV